MRWAPPLAFGPRPFGPRPSPLMGNPIPYPGGKLAPIARGIAGRLGFRAVLLPPYRADTNKPPPLRIFGRRIFPEVFIILQKSWQNFLWLLLFSKIFRLRRAFIIIFFSEGQIWTPWGSIF